MWSRKYREDNKQKMAVQTSITNVSNSIHDNAAYNLSGQKVDRNSLKRGIYIIGGKKIIVK